MHIDQQQEEHIILNQTFCWECYSCVKACPQNAIDARGYADFAPMVTVFVFFERKKKELFHGRLNLEMEEKKFVSLLEQLHGVQ